MAYPVLQNEEPGDRRDQRRESAFERREGEARASSSRRRSVESLAAGHRGRVRGDRTAGAARTGCRGTSAISRDACQRGAPRKVAGTTAAGGGAHAAAGSAPGQERTAGADA